ncbi:glycosyltransferase family 2 protein [Paenibacillus elgii]|nr:glycosyltransferase family 2 protein [Paenibacillus elgii]
MKDEEEQLPRSLTSVAGIASEIIVVDTGSTDRSAAIAREFGASVYDHEWGDDFSKARNQALDVASGDWILMLDADEELAPECLPLLSESLCRSDAFAYALHFVNYYGQLTEYLSFTDSCCRLFRNLPNLRYSGKIHEDIVPSLLKRHLTPIPSRITIRHYGYLENRVRQKRKPQRNAALLAKAIAETPGDSRLQYALGTEYLHAEQYSEAMGVFLPLLKSLEPSCGFYPDLLLKTALLLRVQRSNDEALRLVKEGLRLLPDFTDLWDLLGDLSVIVSEQQIIVLVALLSRQILQAVPADRPQSFGPVHDRMDESLGHLIPSRLVQQSEQLRDRTRNGCAAHALPFGCHSPAAVNIPGQTHGSCGRSCRKACSGAVQPAGNSISG